MIIAFLANIISFPGLGIGEFSLDPVAFRLPLPWVEGGHKIMWYGIIITLAMIAGFTVALGRSKREGIKTDDMFDLAIYLIVFCIMGARLYYVLSKPQSYSSFKDIIAIWNGGLAIYGGIIAGILTIAVYTKIKKISTTRLFDAAAPGLILGQAIGRWGNFCNAEAYGAPTTLPWRMCSPQIAAELLRDGYVSAAEHAEVLAGTLGVHPTFLYESIWNILGFGLLMLIYNKKKFNGQIALTYGIWYGFGRFFIEGLRTDSLYFLEGVLGKTVRVSQMVAVLCVIGGIITTVICLRRVKAKRFDEADYEPIYTAPHDTAMDNSATYESKDADSTVSESDPINDETKDNITKEN